MSDASKRPGGWLKAIGLVVVVIGLAGGYWWWQRNGAALAATVSSGRAEAAGAASASTEGALITFDPFLVNLASSNGAQYLRTKVQLVIADEDRATDIAERPVAIMRLRSGLLELLAEQRADVLVTAEGKAALRKSIQERAETIIGAPILDVLFADFVVQF